MKVLTAFNILPDQKQELLEVKNLFDLPNRTDDSYMQYLETVIKDMDKNGMKNPIVYLIKVMKKIKKKK